MKIIQQSATYQVEMSNEEWNKIGQQNKWQKTAQENTYSNECNVSVGLHEQTPNKENLDYGTAKTTIRFSIEQEHREWGIKDVILTVKNVEPIHIIITDYSSGQDVEKPITVLVDPSLLQIDYIPGRYITTGSMDLYLNPDYTVDYKRTELQVFNNFQHR